MKMSERIVKLFNTTNERLKRAYLQVYHLYNNHVGGLENTVSDYGENSTEGKNAIAFMTNTEKLRDFLYKEAFFGDTVYMEGGYAWGRKQYTQDLRFIGEDAMRTIVDWVLNCRNRTAEYPCKWGLDEFNAAHPNHKQEADAPQG